MTIRGYQKPLYILPFDHRGSFEAGMFGWKGDLTAEQTAQIAAAKRVIYDGFQQALADGVPAENAGILVDEQFGAAILRDASTNGHIFACPLKKAGRMSSISSMAKILPRTSRPFILRFPKCRCAITPGASRC